MIDPSEKINLPATSSPHMIQVGNWCAPMKFKNTATAAATSLKTEIGNYIVGNMQGIIRTLHRLRFRVIFPFYAHCCSSMCVFSNSLPSVSMLAYSRRNSPSVVVVVVAVRFLQHPSSSFPPSPPSVSSSFPLQTS